MRIIHVVGGIEASDGGPAYSVPRLSAAVKAAGLSPEVWTVGEPGRAATGDAVFHKQDLRLLGPARSLRLSAALERNLRKQAPRLDLVHSHGLWLMPNVHGGRAAARSGKPLVVSPRGMVAPAALAFSRTRKRLFWALLQRAAYARAALWHATSEEEADDIRAFGVRAPIAVVPNGIDLPPAIATHPDMAGERRLLFLSRIHPKKNLAALLDAWQALAAERPDWTLTIAGPDEGGHRAELERRIARDGLVRVAFTGPVAGPAKDDLIAGSDLFVLPTLSENFGLVVAEALGAGVPVVVTKGAPWAGLGPRQAGWWIDHGAEPLLAALRQATALPAATRRAMGLRGREWMREEFAWDAIGRDMAASYLWLAGRGERPAFVQQG